MRWRALFLLLVFAMLSFHVPRASAYDWDPITVGTPWQIRGTYRIELPADMRIANLPNSTQIKSDFGGFDVAYSLDGDNLVVSLTLSFTQSRISPKQYPAFRDFLNSCLRVEMQRIRIVKAS